MRKSQKERYKERLATEEENEFRSILNEYRLSPGAIDVLAKDAIEIYDKSFPATSVLARHQRAKVALKLACDKNDCAIDPLGRGTVGIKYIAKARELTNIPQVLDPVKRVDGQIKRLVNRGQLKPEDGQRIGAHAKQLLKEFRGVTGKSRPAGSDTYAAASAAIYISSVLHGEKLPQYIFRELFGVGVLTKPYKEIAEAIDIEIIF